MPLISFFARRMLTGAAARALTNFLVRRFKLAPGAANIVFVVLTELLARGTERGTQPGTPKKGGFGGKFGRR